MKRPGGTWEPIVRGEKGEHQLDTGPLLSSREFDEILAPTDFENHVDVTNNLGYQAILGNPAGNYDVYHANLDEKDSSHRKDSREKDHNHEKDHNPGKNSHEKDHNREKNSHEKDHNREKNSHEKDHNREKNSHEKDHNREKNSHEKDHNREKNSHGKDHNREKNSHEKDHNREKNSHEKDHNREKNSQHNLEKDSHEMDHSHQGDSKHDHVWGSHQKSAEAGRDGKDVRKATLGHARRQGRDQQPPTREAPWLHCRTRQGEGDASCACQGSPSHHSQHQAGVGGLRWQGQADS